MFRRTLALALAAWAASIDHGMALEMTELEVNIHARNIGI